ncbi:MAG TPA: UBP-type zinc finger domain-containing protein [Mycobacteriales bacterium]|jgi:CPA1 family monovalent cation:H+ antiporter|nr:UBP-type zinc finger domain-containing protein [Mycobacteriales bacterium]
MSPLRGSLRRLLPTGPRAHDPDPSCDELREAPGDAVPTTPGGCAECLAQGTTWVHLRMCLTCGHVGCCDTGPHKHARTHAESAGHPVMRSHEPGETWRWCFVHELLG